MRSSGEESLGERSRGSEEQGRGVDIDLDMPTFGSMGGEEDASAEALVALMARIAPEDEHGSLGPMWDFGSGVKSYAGPGPLPRSTGQVQLEARDDVHWREENLADVGAHENGVDKSLDISDVFDCKGLDEGSGEQR